MLGSEVTFLGLNLLAILTIVGLTETFKDLVPLENKKWYLVVSFVLAALMAFVARGAGEVAWFTLVFNALVYFTVSKLFYDAVLQFVEKKKKELAQRVDR